MESPDFYPEQDMDIMPELRAEFMEQAYTAFVVAGRLSAEHAEDYVMYYPSETPDVEVKGVMLTTDGIRPLSKEWDKEYLMLYYPVEQTEDEAGVPPVIWIKDRRRYTDEQGRDSWYEERRYILTKIGLQPYEECLDAELPEDVTAASGQTEATQLYQLKERLQQFELTPLQKPRRDYLSEQ